MATRALRNLRHSVDRYLCIASDVDEWFHTNEALHAQLASFAERNCERTSVFRKVAIDAARARQDVAVYCDSLSSQEFDHEVHSVNEDLCAYFEGLLEEYIQQRRVSMEEFQETYRISQREERRDGRHFHRWMEIIELPVCVALMAGSFRVSLHDDAVEVVVDGNAGVTTALAKVQRIAAAAKRSFRRRAILRPLLALWCPGSFEEIFEVLRRSQVRSGLAKEDLKALARWRHKLMEKVLGPDNVYVPATADEAQWSRYLAAYSSKMSDEDFEAFAEELKHVAAQQQSSSTDAQETETPPRGTGGSIVAQECRRACWQAFNAIDVTHAGCVSLFVVGRALQHAGAFHSASHHKRLMIQCREALKGDQRNQLLQVLSDTNERILGASFRVSAKSSAPKAGRAISPDDEIVPGAEDDAAAVRTVSGGSGAVLSEEEEADDSMLLDLQRFTWFISKVFNFEWGYSGSRQVAMEKAGVLPERQREAANFCESVLHLAARAADLVI